MWTSGRRNTITVTQQGEETYESEDYSADGQTEMLQEATEGEGIPIVLMGDGFTDADIADSTYGDEGLGIYEGACTYMFGVYRPSEDSMMNSNTCGFNAPSRKYIYDKVIARGEGRDTDYDEFVEFDSSIAESGTSAASLNSTRSVSSSGHFARPRMAGFSLD